MVMSKNLIFMAIALLSIVLSAPAQNLVQNGDFEAWTNNWPDNWTKESGGAVSRVPGLDGTGYAVNLIKTSNDTDAIKQNLSTPITDSFYLQFDFAFGDPGSARAMDVTIKGGANNVSVLHPRVNGAQLEFYNGVAKAWVVVPGTQGKMLASNFATNTIVAYRLIAKGTWTGDYTVSVKSLTTGTDIVVDVPVSVWQEIPSPRNGTSIYLERGRSGADWRADNVMVFAQDPRIPVVDAGAPIQVAAPDNTVQMNPSVFDLDTAQEDLTYAWTQVSGPAASFSTVPGETANDPQAAAILDGGPGLYVFKVTVTDPQSNTGEDTVLVRFKGAGDSVLLGRWDFEDQPQGDTAVDTLDPSLGNVGADNGTLGPISLATDPNSDPNWAEGWVGEAALLFKGNDLVSIDVDESVDPNMTGLQWEISLAAWVKPDVGTLTTTYNTIVARANPFTWVLRQLNTGVAEFTLALESGNLFTAGTVKLVDGHWHHVAGTYDGKEVKIYVDGILDVSRPASGLLKLFPEAEVTIGGRHGDGHPWRGLLDDVRVYSYALSPEEIQELVRLGANVVPYVAIDDTVPTELIIAFRDSVELTAKITDWNIDQGQALTVAWSVPDVTMADKVQFADAQSANTTATFFEPGIYTLRLSVQDAFGASAYDEITIIVKDAVCRDLLVVDPQSGLLVNPTLSFDISGPDGEPDCYVNLYDLAVLAQQWALCNDPQGEGCQPIAR
jgi:hypothetical protein